MPRRKYFKSKKAFNAWYAEYRAKNRDKINEYNKLRMRRVRAEEKAKRPKTEKPRIIAPRG